MITKERSHPDRAGHERSDKHNHTDLEGLPLNYRSECVLTMNTAEVHHLNHMWHRLCKEMSKRGERVDTRNGPAYRLPGTWCITVREPRKRVLFDAKRNCNHVFHLMESIWMLAGGRDTAFVSQFNSNIANYSDDGAVFHAAYGHRWRSHFGVDQVAYAIKALAADPNDRRVVISMWDASSDGNGVEGKDFPCNLMIIPHLYTSSLSGKTHLNFTIINRSNDLVWGLCGANAVHMSMLQEFMAGALGAEVGVWDHITNNLHAYESHMDLVREVGARDNKNEASYELWSGSYGGQYGKMAEIPMIVNPDNWEDFLVECAELCDGKQEGFRNAFLEDTVEPVWASWREWKAGNYEDAIDIAESIDQHDWRTAIVQWYKRALKKKGL